MDNERAKLILQAYRPSGEDAGDSFFAEALEQARLDPELGRWFAEQRAFDERARLSFQAVTPPRDLRDSILFVGKVTAMQETRAWWRFGSRPTLRLALAATVVLLLGVGVLFRLPSHPAPMTADTFDRQIVDLVDSGKISLGKMGDNTSDLRIWLARRGAPHDFEVPSGLRDIPSMGCQSFVVNGAKVTLVCFTLDKDQVVHLFVIDQSALKDAHGTVPVITRKGGNAIATWSVGGKSYLLAGMNMDEEALRRLI